MVINRTQTTTRQMKALTIVGQNDQIKRINATNYKVKSQSSDFWYDVTRVPQESQWDCSCPDHRCPFLLRFDHRQAATHEVTWT